MKGVWSYIIPDVDGPFCDFESLECSRDRTRPAPQGMKPWSWRASRKKNEKEFQMCDRHRFLTEHRSFDPRKGVAA
jgi:hypothetical protein